MLHYIYLGHFQHEGDFIRIKKLPGRLAGSRILVERPLDLTVLSRLLELRGLSPESIPESWNLSVSDEEYIVWECSVVDPGAAEFLSSLREHTGCDIADYS